MDEVSSVSSATILRDIKKIAEYANTLSNSMNTCLQDRNIDLGETFLQKAKQAVLEIKNLCTLYAYLEIIDSSNHGDI